MEDSRLQHEPQKQFHPDGLKGHTLYFRAPPKLNEEEVVLFFEDLTKSIPHCQKEGFIVRVTFSDSKALQQAVNGSTSTIGNESVLRPLPRAAVALSPASSGHTLHFYAPLTINEEEVGLLVEDLAGSQVQCHIEECVVRLTFYDSEAVQRIVNIPSHVIGNECVLRHFPGAAAMLSTLTNDAHPVHESSASSAEPLAEDAFSQGNATAKSDVQPSSSGVGTNLSPQENAAASADLQPSSRDFGTKPCPQENATAKAEFHPSSAGIGTKPTPQGIVTTNSERQPSSTIVEGFDCLKAGVTRVVFTLNVDCQEHITTYCLDDLNRCLSSSRCAVRKTEVPGQLLLEYNDSTSQFDVDQIIKEINKYSQKFSAIVVALPGNYSEKNLEHLFQSCRAEVSYRFIGRFSESQLYKICYEATCIPNLLRLLPEATLVPLVRHPSSADACSAAGLTRREVEDSHTGTSCAVTADLSTSDTIKKSPSDVVPNDILVPTIGLQNRDALPRTVAHGKDATSTAAAAFSSQGVANRTGGMVADRIPPIGELGSNTSVILPAATAAIGIDAERSFVGASSNSAAFESQRAADVSEVNSSAKFNVQKTSVPIDSAKRTTSRSDRSDTGAGTMPLTVPVEERFVQLFKSRLEGGFRDELIKLFPVGEPEGRVEFIYDNKGFHFFGSRRNVLKAKALLYTHLESLLQNEIQPETSQLDDSTSSRQIRNTDYEVQPYKPNDVSATYGAVAGRAVEATTPAISSTKAHMLKKLSKDDLPSKSGGNREQPSEAMLTREEPNDYRRNSELSTEVDTSLTSEPLTLQLNRGSVAEQEADVLVNSVDCGLTLSEGKISSSMLAKGGERLQLELWQNYPKGVGEFEFAVSDAYGLPCKMVFHVACGRYKGIPSEQRFSSVIFECLKRADEFGMKSIVFPAIGAGVLAYPPKAVITLLHSAVRDFSVICPRRNLQSVKCVVYDKQTYELFKFELAMLLRDDGAYRRRPIRDSSSMIAVHDRSAPASSNGSEKSSSYAGTHWSMISHEPPPGTGSLPLLPNALTVAHQPLRPTMAAAGDPQADKKYLQDNYASKGSHFRQSEAALTKDSQQLRTSKSQRQESATSPAASTFAHPSTGASDWSRISSSYASTQPSRDDWLYSQASSAPTRSQLPAQSSNSYMTSQHVSQLPADYTSTGRSYSQAASERLQPHAKQSSNSYNSTPWR